MSQVEVERFHGRIITDGELREKAMHSPASVCYGEGFVLSARGLALLVSRKMDERERRLGQCRHFIT